MKTIFTFALLVLFSMGVMAQYDSYPVTFETASEDTAWTIFATSDDSNPDLWQLVDNPDKAGLNSSDKVIKFTVPASADPWAGAFSNYYPNIEITTADHILYMMVHKDVVTNCAMKVEGGTDPAQVEVKVPNTVTGEWELLAFDMTAGAGNTYNRLVIFPDFPDARSAGSVTYIDYLSISDPTVAVKKFEGSFFSIYPNPATEMITVQYDGMRSITISNIVGQTMKQMVSGSNYIERIDVTDLRDGVYFVTLDTADGMVTSKFLKK